MPLNPSNKQESIKNAQQFKKLLCFLSFVGILVMLVTKSFPVEKGEAVCRQKCIEGEVD